MKKIQFITTLFLMGVSLYAAPSQHVKASKKNHEEPRPQNIELAINQDEQVFLLPHLQTEKANLIGQRVLDVGYGTSGWALSVAAKGVEICAFDSRKENLEKMQLAVALTGLSQKISFAEGSLLDLPYENAHFDYALSMQVGQQIPAINPYVSEINSSLVGLDKHMQEMARVLKKGGELTIVAPASYEVVFTDATSSLQQAMEHIQQELDHLKELSSERIQERLASLKEVTRATFIEREGRLKLVTQLSDLKVGDRIWRKEADAIYDSIYHSEEEYLIALHNAGLKCVEIKRPCFFGNIKHQLYQQEHKKDKGLGVSYVAHNPFTIFIAVKESSSSSI